MTAVDCSDSSFSDDDADANVGGAADSAAVRIGFLARLRAGFAFAAAVERFLGAAAEDDEEEEEAPPDTLFPLLADEAEAVAAALLAILDDRRTAPCGSDLFCSWCKI